jgi:hypothetical protein
LSLWRESQPKEKAVPIQEADRAEFEAFGDLGFDEDRREILVGLTYEQTEWYLNVLERNRSGRERVTELELQVKSELDGRHNAVRLMLAQAAEEASYNARRAFGKPVRDAKSLGAIHPGAMARSEVAQYKSEDLP